MRRWTSAKNNPNGTPIPPWLRKPLSEQPTKGRIGLQGKHAGAPIWFRNVRIRLTADDELPMIGTAWKAVRF